MSLLDAVRSTVALHPLIKAADEDAAASVARRLEASGAFDLRYSWSGAQSRTYTPLTNYDHALALAAGIDTFSQTQNATVLTANADKLLRNGITVSPSVGVTRLTDNLENLGGVNLTHIDFTVNVPLRRGRGAEAVTANERAAGAISDASALERNETIASLVFSTAESYWEYVAAGKVLEIRRASEQRGREFLDSVRTLIAAQRMPGIEVHQAIANLESQTAARIGSEQRVSEARQNLGYAMGLGAAEAISLVTPTESFPDETAFAAGKPDDAATAGAWIARALRLRPEYLATAKRSNATDILRHAAKNQLLPELDVVLNGGYSGLRMGPRPDQFITSTVGRVQGPDLSAAIRYSFPAGNREARGQLDEAEANYRKSLQVGSDTANRISNSVVTALLGVETSAAALAGARRSVAEYTVALEGQREKLRLAAGSLVDLLTIESRLTASEIDLVNAQLQYALSIVQLRYASGTMLGPDPRRPTLDREAFFQPPPPPGPETKSEGRPN